MSLDDASLVSQGRDQPRPPLRESSLAVHVKQMPTPNCDHGLNRTDGVGRRRARLSQLPIPFPPDAGLEPIVCRPPMSAQCVLMRDLTDPWPVVQESLRVLLTVLAERMPNRLALIRRERTEEPAQVRVPVASGGLTRRHWEGTVRGEGLPARCRGCLHRTVILVVWRTRNSTSWRCWRKPMCRRLAGVFLLAPCSPEDTIWLV